MRAMLSKTEPTMLRQLSNCALLGAAAWMLAMSANAQTPSLPGVPEVPTQASCRDFSRQIYLQLSAIYARESECMDRSRPVVISHGSDCNTLSGKVHYVVTAHPACFTPTAERKCSLIRLRAQEKKCWSDALSSSKSATEKAQAAKEAQAYERGVLISSSLQTTHSLLTDPRALIERHLRRRLNSGLLDRITTKGGNLTPEGMDDMQKLYTAVADNTLMNESLRSTNPLIRAIQGDIANKITQEHLASLDQLHDLVKSIRAVADTSSPQLSQPIRKSRPLPASSNTARDPSCDVLNTDAGLDMAANQPAKFDALMARCIGK